MVVVGNGLWFVKEWCWCWFASVSGSDCRYGDAQRWDFNVIRGGIDWYVDK